MKLINDLECQDKRVFLRVDLNVPVVDGKVIDETRIDKIIPTIEYLINKNAKVILASHFGRPKSAYEEKYSLKFLQSILRNKLKREILFCKDIVSEETCEISKNMQAGEVLLLENLRFFAGETKNELEFIKKLSALADVYINDAFSCSHRAHASITGITEFLPSAAGLLMQEEIENLNKYLINAKRPILAIIGGSKVSTKLDLLKELSKKVDYIAIGGAMANTFLKALGYDVGNSFYEKEFVEVAKSMLNEKFILPKDLVLASDIEASDIEIVKVGSLPNSKMALDLGPETVEQVISIAMMSKTILLNGPVGVFEKPNFAEATNKIVKKVADLSKNQEVISVAGGGDMVAAITQANVFDKITYVSTAGGAFLEWLEGKELPGIKALKDN